MSTNKYTVFIILLVIVIISIIVGIGLLAYRVMVIGSSEEEDAIAHSNKVVEKVLDEDIEDLKDLNERNVENIELDKPEVVPPSDGGSTNSAPEPKKEAYQGFVMIGYIEISKTGIKYPILEKATDKSLEVSVAIMYPEDAAYKLNTPGNVVIMGHNYRNGKFFSNNKKLAIGDKIKITSYNGNLIYTIYDIFETTPGDTSFISRETNGATEISLSTCTDDGARRLIILAKVN